MTFEVETNGRRRAVTVRRRPDGWDVLVDGQEKSADMAPAGDRWSLLLDGRSYDVALGPPSRGSRLVHVNGIPVAVTVADPRAAFGTRARHEDAADGEPLHLTSPMPGRVVKVLVKPGDAVAARQGLVVIEAMKMENELRAPRAATVSDVRVNEGASVDATTVLVVLE